MTEDLTEAEESSASKAEPAPVPASAPASEEAACALGDECAGATKHEHAPDEPPEGLTDEDIAAADALIEGVPRFNLGAFFLPGIWGPGHGIWACILFYPIWLFADNTFYTAYASPSVMSAVFAALVFVILTAVTVAFGFLSQRIGLFKALEKGKTKEQYLHNERIWAVVCVVLGIVFLIVATFYNLQIRPTLE